MPISISRERDSLDHLNRHIKKLLNGDGAFIDRMSLDQRQLPSDQTVVVSVRVIGDALRIQMHVGTNVPVWNNLGDLPLTTDQTFWFALVVDETEGKPASKKATHYKLATINNPTVTNTTLGRVYQTCVMMGVDLEAPVEVAA